MSAKRPTYKEIARDAIVHLQRPRKGASLPGIKTYVKSAFGMFQNWRLLSALKEFKVDSRYQVDTRKRVRVPPEPDRLACPVVRFQILRGGDGNDHRGGPKFVSRVVQIILKPGDTLSPASIQFAAEAFAREKSSLDTYVNKSLTFEFDSIDSDGTITSLDGADLHHIHMCSSLVYIGDEKVQFVTGHCVLDALLQRINSYDHTNIAADIRSPVNMIDFYKSSICDWNLLKGLTLQHIIDWVKSPYVDGRVSLYAIGPDDKIFSHYIGRGGQGKARIVIGIRVLSDHLSLLPKHLNQSLSACVNGYVNQTTTWPDDIDMYNRVQVTGDPQISAFIDLIVTEQSVPGGYLSSFSQFEPVESKGANGVILWSPETDFDMMNFAKTLISSLATSLDAVFPIKWGSDSIKAVKIRDDLFLYFTTEDLQVVEKTICGLRSKIPLMPMFSTKNRNQSLTSVALEYYNSRIGVIPKSNLNPVVFEIFELAKRGGLNKKSSPVTKCDWKIDTVKAYSCALITNEFQYCVFDIRSDFVRFESCDCISLVCGCIVVIPGFYALIKPVTVCGYTIDDGLYPYFAIQFFLRMNVIELSDITHWIKPNNLLQSDTFKQATLDLYTMMPDPALVKALPNRFVGSLGRSNQTQIYGAMTTSLHLSEALHGQIYNDVIPECHKIGGVYYTHYEKSTPLHLNHLPVWSHVVWLAKIAEFEKLRVFTVAGFKSMGLETDATYITLINDRVFDVSHEIVIARSVQQESIQPLLKSSSTIEKIQRMQLVEQNKTRRTSGLEPLLIQTKFGCTSSSIVLSSVSSSSVPVKPVHVKSIQAKSIPSVGSIHVKTWFDANALVCTKNVNDVQLPCEIGQWRLEPSVRDIKQTPDISDNRAEQIRCLVNKPPQWAVNTEFETDFWNESKASACFTGGPGCGKSTLLASLADRGFVLAPRGSPLQELIRDKGIQQEMAATFDYILEKNNRNIWRAAKELSIHDRISVDEFSQITSIHLSLLVATKLKNPNCQFLVFGDVDQCRPIAFGDNSYNYLNCSALIWLCDENLVRLPYRLGQSRFDPRLTHVVQEFKRTSFIPYKSVQHAHDSQINEFNIHICFTNAKKILIDKLCMDKFNQGKTVLQVIKAKSDKDHKWRQDIHLTTGLPLMARENIKGKKDQPRRSWNAQRFIVHSLKGTQIVLTRLIDGTQIEFTQSEVAKSFDLNFTLTAHRAQSITIREPYMVHLEQYNVECETLYVALSRGTTWDNVFFNTLQLFEPVPPKPYIIESRLSRLIGPLDCVIYSAKCKSNLLEYRGQSQITGDRTPKQQLDKRMNEHINAKKKTDFEKKLVEYGVDEFETRLLHRALYYNSMDVHRDETNFIQEVNFDLCMNMIQTNNIEGRQSKRSEIDIKSYRLQDIRLGVIKTSEFNRYSFKFPGVVSVRVRVRCQQDAITEFRSAALSYGNTVDMYEYCGGIESYAKRLLGELNQSV